VADEKKNHITIDDFAKIELRVGLVEQAEHIPGTRLLRLIVNLGDEKRQILSGIAEYYKPEDLVGKKVVVVANLKPKKIRGYLSEGMILAAGCEEGQRPVLVTVGEEAEPGWRIC